MSFATAMAMRDMSEKIVSLQGEIDIYKAEVRFRQSLVERLQGEVEAMRRLVADDGYAMTFQTMGQYRTALLKAMAARTGGQG